jgi:DMSO/TMAO reductase YedYZ molybdopterin-dependent catalytic subunit
MSDPIDRRHFLKFAAGTTLMTRLPDQTAGAAGSAPADGSDRGLGEGEIDSRQFLTDASKFVDVSRGKPRPHTLRGEALVQARLTPSTWRLEIVGDKSADVARPSRLEDNSALDLANLRELGKSHGVKFLKAMQCNNIPYPLGQGLWEGVPLRDVLSRAGKVGNVRRVYYWGFHNNDPDQLFQSSLAFNRVMETPPWEPPPIVAYRLNGQDIPLERGGPVRMVVPWAHGFKSIKWLQRIVLTNDYQANDTYALQNNDPESSLKTAAYMNTGSLSFKTGDPVSIPGMAMVGVSGLRRVEYWLRAATGEDSALADDDPAWNTAEWRACELMAPPDQWNGILPGGTSSTEVWGFDRETGRPKNWPLPYSMVPWRARLDRLRPGKYEFRARTVDLNGFAQPEPRPYQKSGMNHIPLRRLDVKA